MAYKGYEIMALCSATQLWKVDEFGRAVEFAQDFDSVHIDWYEVHSGAGYLHHFSDLEAAKAWIDASVAAADEQ